MATTLINNIIYWKKKLDKNPDEDVILNVIRKLSKIPITLEILEATHIGKCIRKLSKRDDSVGEKAKAVLNKWRDIFVNLECVKNSKQQSIRKVGIVKKDKFSSEQDSSQEKSIYHHDQESSHEFKQKHKNNLIESSHASSKYEVKKSHSNSIDYNPNVEANITYNPECPEFFPTDNKMMKRKLLSLVDTYEPSSLKRKLESENDSDVKKFVLKNLHEKKKHSTHKNEDNSCSLHQKDIKSENKNTVEKNSSSHVKKLKSEKSKEKNFTKSDTVKPKVKIHLSEEFTSSSVSFEDCLGFNDIVTSKKKKISKSQLPTRNLDTVKCKNRVTNEKGNCKSSSSLEKSLHSYKKKHSDSIPKQSAISDGTHFVLPNVQPNCRPVAQSQDSKKNILSNEDVIKFTSSRKEKTAIYSGRKNFYRKVPTLFECCIRYFIENIDIIGPMKGVPYHLMKPVLEKCTATQLYVFESYNPHLLENTNELWEIHCKRDFKLLSPLEHETWRDVYLRGRDERERKLKNVTANISASMLKANPVRQLKLAYVDSVVKPPRDVARRQAKNGIVVLDTYDVKSGSLSKVNTKKTTVTASSITSNKSTIASTNHSVKTHSESSCSETFVNESPKPVTPVVDSTASNKNANVNIVLAPKKPKVAPLMAKTLKSMKQCFRR